MTSTFRFDRDDKTFTPVFQEAVAIVEKLLGDRQVVTELAAPIVMMYPRVGGRIAPLRNKIGGMVLDTINAGFTVTADAQGHPIMKISAHNNHISINRQFLTCNERNGVIRDRCLLLLAVKLLHQVFCGLTITFYTLTGHEPQRRDKCGALLHLYPAPITVGQSYSSYRAITGNNGYALEEYFLKGRLGTGHRGYNSPLVLLCPTATALDTSPTFIVPDVLVQTVLNTLRKTKLTKDDILQNLRLLPEKPNKYVPQPLIATSTSSVGVKRRSTSQAQPAWKRGSSQSWEMSLLHADDPELAESSQASSAAVSDEGEDDVDSAVLRLITSRSKGGRKE
jgi:hypothetical protein